jgi:hypothetical protein
MILRYRNTLRDHRLKMERDTYIRDLMRGVVVVGIALLILTIGLRVI